MERMSGLSSRLNTRNFAWPDPTSLWGFGIKAVSLVQSPGRCRRQLYKLSCYSRSQIVGSNAGAIWPLPHSLPEMRGSRGGLLHVYYGFDNISPSPASEWD